MAWRQLSITLGATDPEPVEQLLTELGALAVTLEDAGDEPLLEPGPGETPLWSSLQLKALFADDIDRDLVVRRLREAGLAEPHWEDLADREWERAWLDDFEPMSFAGSLWVLPHGAASPAPADATIVRLDPGLAFGTGRHATTALCLEWLATHDVRDRTIIDYGCGSGLLAIAAAKLGARHVRCLDIDEQALDATRANAAANCVADRLVVAHPDDDDLTGADVIVANILAGTLDALAPELARRLETGGSVVLSGILDDQAAAVGARYDEFFEMEPPTLRAGWARLNGKRRNRVHAMS